MPKTVILTNHFASSRRKGNIHWIADELVTDGHEVTFLVTGMSWLSRLNRDTRIPYLSAANRRHLETLRPGLRQYVLYTPLHPVNLRNRLLNSVAAVLCTAYPWLAFDRNTRHLVMDADYIILEPGLPLLFIRLLKRISPRSRIIYRASDDITTVACHPAVVTAERDYIRCHLVSLQSSDFSYRFPHATRLIVQPPSIASDLLDAECPSPYSDPPRLRFLSVGSSFFDHDFVQTLARLFPEAEIVVIGNISLPAPPENITLLCEMPFASIIPYMRCCDIGLAPYDAKRITPGLAQSSHKITQFRYLRKPLITSEVLCASPTPGIFGYRMNEPESIRRAAHSAIEAIGSLPAFKPSETWTQVARQLVAAAAAS